MTCKQISANFNDKLLFLLTKLAFETNACLFKRWNNQSFVSKAVISSHENHRSSHLGVP